MILGPALGEGRILVADGAWGTELHALGLGDGACPELWCAERPELVRDLASRYAAAGAELVWTNSFGGNRYRLAAFGLGSRAGELCEAAARLSREGAAGRALVVGSIGPTGLFPSRGAARFGDFAGGVDALRDAYAEQALALARGGAEALCVETMMDSREAAIAVRAAKEATSLELICSFSFLVGSEGRVMTIAGQGIEEAARAAIEAGADALGANCGRGFAEMALVIRALKPFARGMPILAKPNAGLPSRRSDGTLAYHEGPELAASLVPELVRGGASIVGGCCGTGPAHVAAIRRALDSRPSRD